MSSMFQKMKFEQKSSKEFFNEENYHECIMNVYDIISRKGFTFKNNDISYSAHSFMNYLFMSLRNEMYINNIHENKIEREYDFDLEMYSDGELEEDLREEKVKEYHIINEIYDYVEKNYSWIESAQFKHYYKTGYSLRKLSKINGYSVAELCHTVKKIREAIQREFNFNLPGRKRK